MRVRAVFLRDHGRKRTVDELRAVSPIDGLFTISRVPMRVEPPLPIGVEPVLEVRATLGIQQPEGYTLLHVLHGAIGTKLTEHGDVIVVGQQDRYDGVGRTSVAPQARWLRPAIDSADNAERHRALMAEVYEAAKDYKKPSRQPRPGDWKWKKDV